MDYGKDILNRLIDIYERRGAYDKEPSSLRAIQIDVKKVYPAYTDRYNHNVYREINTAIEKLCIEGYVTAKQDNTGQYSKVKLNVDMVQECYKITKRTGIPEQCEKVKKVLTGELVRESFKNEECSLELLKTVISDWLSLLTQYKKLPYDLKYDSKRVKEIIDVLYAILQLKKENYIRNFSTALFRDSKRFQKEFRGTIESILYDYTDEVLEKNKILEFYNLYENPTYVLIKGNVRIQIGTSAIEVMDIPDGIALSNASLEIIESITVKASKVITVENLTTYHDSDEEDSVHIYLGGYHNYSKQLLLEKIYLENKKCGYFHKGDLDVYGFLILENLKEKTGIPFVPLEMDVNTLCRFCHAGIYKELTASDIKVIEEKMNTKLCAYADVLKYMLDHNCKVEQESVKALELMEQNVIEDAT